jgi:hypothetical protein
MGIDPVDVGEGASAHVMVNADEETIFEAFQPGAMNAVALEYDGRLITTGYAIRLHHFVGKRQRTVDARNAIVQNDIRLLAHGAKHLAAGQRRSDGVAVGPGMRRQHEALVLSDLPQYVFEHVAMASLHFTFAFL